MGRRHDYDEERIWWLQTKHRGEWAEMQFLARASQHGLIVSKPWGESARYDFLVDFRGSVNRVQVKSCSVPMANGRYKFQLGKRTLKNDEWWLKQYSKQQIDFFALYIPPEDLWYIVPVQVRGAGSATVDPRSGMNCYAKYREGWKLLKS